MKSISITRLKQHSRLRKNRQKKTWNEKHLDYEIETYPRNASNLRWEGHLKWKASRLRDWNFPVNPIRLPNQPLLKWKASRLRDWNLSAFLQRDTEFDNPEMKSISITRLKRGLNSRLSSPRNSTWNEKHLDYEIETRIPVISASRRSTPEMKSISITRLKLTYALRMPAGYVCPEMKSISITRLKLVSISSASVKIILKWKASRLRDWNHIRPLWGVVLPLSEMKSISITRLKPQLLPAPIESSRAEMKSISITRLKLQRLRTSTHRFSTEMKSISITRLKRGWGHSLRREPGPWNEKHLDYEIETFLQGERGSSRGYLKWKASRLRDWNKGASAGPGESNPCLKWKASRLRDWNRK